jgi:hypothetical protein
LVDVMERPQDGVAHLGDIETAMQREVDILCQRFPTADRDEIDTCVRTTYDELLRDAEIEAHVLAVTRAKVSETMRQRGYHVHG